MTPVDGIQAPRRKRAPTARTPRATRKTTPAPVPSAPTQPQATALPIPEPHTAGGGRERLVWAIAIGITAVIFISWVILFSGGSLKSADTDSSFWSRISNRLGSFIETVQTDWFHLKSDLNTTNTNATTVDEERIKQLEEQVFPQFTDPTKQ
ncbi:MAG: hypothetical protein HZC01_01635 [Candidatus Kerfeldbacteria bacterium]|nr:hypothetical protein [Candidatus Kerfeldbacteria bacterium]